MQRAARRVGILERRAVGRLGKQDGEQYRHRDDEQSGDGRNRQRLDRGPQRGAQ